MQSNFNADTCDNPNAWNEQLNEIIVFSLGAFFFLFLLQLFTSLLTFLYFSFCG